MEMSTEDKNGELVIAAARSGTASKIGGPRDSVSDPDATGLSVLDRIADSLERQAEQLRRLADHFDPPPAPIVDSVYLAERLDCTTSWIAQMARRGEIPQSCIVTGTGNGKPWKFYGTAIEQWIEMR